MKIMILTIFALFSVSISFGQTYPPLTSHEAIFIDDFKGLAPDYDHIQDEKLFLLIKKKYWPDISRTAMINKLGSGPVATKGTSRPIEERILGADQAWFLRMGTIKDIKVSSLRIRQVRVIAMFCPGRYADVLELDGPFNEDAVYILEKLLTSMKTCNSAPIVTLNSGGGFLDSGIEVGKMFRKYGVQSMILDGQKCFSSCSTAFFGGHWRHMDQGGEILMHSPYLKKSSETIKCLSKNKSKHLEKYYTQMLGTKVGHVIFERTMKYCGMFEGWHLNGDAADVFGLLKIKL